MWAMFVNGPKFPKFWLFETFHIVIGHLVLVTFIHFIDITTEGVVVKILDQKHLDIFYESLKFFFSRNKDLNFFQRLGRNL
jgi:hypothetical protein